MLLLLLLLISLCFARRTREAKEGPSSSLALRMRDPVHTGAVPSSSGGAANFSTEVSATKIFQGIIFWGFPLILDFLPSTN